MESLYIQAGILKGRKIPIPSSVHGHLHFTPSKFKEAVFSILESLYLNGTIQKEKSVFIDLFAGSGQIGFEAYSRGFGNVIMVELEKSRFRSLLEVSNKLKLPINLHNKDSFRFAKSFQPKENISIFFLDPPYTFWETQKDKLLELIAHCKVQNSILLVQTPNGVELENMESREFGKNLLWTGLFLSNSNLE